MRVFCPEHKRGFFAPRQSPIKCENRGHVLGELNFSHEAGSQVELQWQYCCNCEHFCPISPEQQDLDRCPVCTRRTSTLYICDHCFTITFESNTPLANKNFTLSAEGLPQPSCPGCLQDTSAEVREHICDELGGSFTTALSSCPICNERLDIGPTFPCAVAQYLRRTKTANKLNVTFDYDTGLFVPVHDGEFVLVTDGADSKQAVVLPRLTHLSTTREFYELYQDYYHHSAPLKAGELYINEPALAEHTGDGWKFQTTGLLEVLDDQPKVRPRNKIRLGDSESPSVEPPRPAPAPEMPAARQKLRPGDIDTSAPADSVARMPAAKAEASGGVCSHCGSMVEERYAFCWHCGKPMKAGNAPPKRRFVIDVDEGSTVEPRGADAQSSSYSADSQREAKRLPRRANSGLKLMLLVMIAGAGMLLAMGAAFWLKQSDTPRATDLVAQASTASLQSDRNFVPTVEASSQPTAEPTQTIPTARPGEDELRQLRQRRNAATATDRSNIVRDSVRLERQFPNDYRFPYERAKLAVMSPQTKSYESAFKALSQAAEKAIRAGKAQEMLQSLDVDRTGDFRKLSRGHVEWSQLVQALRSRDVKLLAGNIRIAQAG